MGCLKTLNTKVVAVQLGYRYLDTPREKVCLCFKQAYCPNCLLMPLLVKTVDIIRGINPEFDLILPHSLLSLGVIQIHPIQVPPFSRRFVAEVICIARDVDP